MVAERRVTFTFELPSEERAYLDSLARFAYQWGLISKDVHMEFIRFCLNLGGTLINQGRIYQPNRAFFTQVVDGHPNLTVMAVAIPPDSRQELERLALIAQESKLLRRNSAGEFTRLCLNLGADAVYRTYMERKGE